MVSGLIFSTADALLYCTETWRKTSDEGKYTAVVSLDLSKAFDSIDHSILLIKLQSLGFQQSAINLIKNYLTNRKQAVKVKNVLSDWSNIKYGVPQGTILGPLLFTLYVNDMSDYIQCNYTQYADDTLLYTAEKQLEDAILKLSQNCNKIIDYFNMHKLTVNVSKTNFLIIPPSKKSMIENNIITIQDKAIEPKKEIKYLGVYIDQFFNYDTQVKNIVGKMAMGIQSIKYLTTYIPQKARLQLLHALVICHLNYSALLFNGISQRNKNKLEKQLNWGIRVCFNVSRSTSTRDLKLKARVLNTNFHRNYFTLNKFATIYSGTCKPFSEIQFPNLELRESRRSSKQLQPLKSKKKVLSGSFLSNAIKLWNNVPTHIREVSSNPKKFKRWIFNHLLIEQSMALPWNLANVWSEYTINN